MTTERGLMVALRSILRDAQRDQSIYRGCKCIRCGQHTRRKVPPAGPFVCAACCRLFARSRPC